MYVKADWEKKLERMLEGELLDVVIDSGGGDIMGKVSKVVKPGGRVVVYGMCVRLHTLSHSQLFKKNKNQLIGPRHQQ
jgi:NADPH:quinone reductase-like Zn-dependent oxidoreductase